MKHVPWPSPLKCSADTRSMGTSRDPRARMFPRLGGSGAAQTIGLGKVHIHGQEIAHTALGLDERGPLRVGFDLLPQLAD